VDVKPVPEEYVHAIKPHISRQVWAMIELQLLTGMRPGEVCQLRTCDLDTTVKVWLYAPPRHKTSYLGHSRHIRIGPKAQAVLAPFLKPDLQAFVFSPADAERERRDAMHRARRTPLSCGNRPGTHRRREPKKGPGAHFSRSSYLNAICAGCDAAFPPPSELARRRVAARRGTNATRWESIQEWKQRLGDKKWAEWKWWREDHRWHPNQLRHTAGTKIRKEYGLEAARVILGHRSTQTSEIYAEIDQMKAEQIMAEVG
jgi:integrase